MKKKIIIGIIVISLIAITLWLTHARYWYTYNDGCTEVGYNIFGIKYETNKCSNNKENINELDNK